MKALLFAGPFRIIGPIFILVSTLSFKLHSQNNALHFDGSNDHVLINSSAALNFSINSSFTIEGWFKKTATSDGEIFSKMDDNPPYSGYELYTTFGGKVSFLFINNWTSNCIWVSSVNSFNDGIWHHVAAVYKGIPNANNVDLIVDGVLQNKTITYNTLTGPTNTNNNCCIGARDGSNYFMNGSIDEVRIWNRALCSSEITTRKNCNLLGNENGLVAYYNFNQGIASANNAGIISLLDLSINVNTGTLNNMSLNGATSNWIASGSNITGTCSAFVTPITVTGNATVCSGNSCTLTASGMNTYTWSNGANTSVLVFTPTVSTNFTITGTTASGCISETMVTVSLDPTPTVSIIGGSNICSGYTLNLIASGATNYTWSTGTTFPNLIVSPSVTTTFSVTGSTSYGCIGNAVTTVIVSPAVTISVSTTQSMVCRGITVSLTASGANSYTWQPGNLTGFLVTVTPSASTIYSVTGTAASGCITSNTISQQVVICPGIREGSQAGYAPPIIYPNPNHGEFTIELKETNRLIRAEIYNYLGALILKSDLTEKTEKFNLIGFADGIYSILIYEDKRLVHQSKIFKQ